MKYIKPIYSSLVAAGKTELAKQWFSENEKFYHPIAVRQIRGILYPENKMKKTQVMDLVDKYSLLNRVT